MKRIIQGLFLATLISAAQASPFPMGGDEGSGPANEWTYADRHIGDRDVRIGTAFPMGSDDVSGPAPHSTYADSHAGDRDMLAGNPFPVGGDDGSGPAPRSTYAEAYAQREQLAGSAGQTAALSE